MAVKKRPRAGSARGCLYAYNLSGNRHTPRRNNMTTTIGGADQGCICSLAFQHKVRLLSKDFLTGEVYHARVS
jgi:hypothetical protein